VYFIDNLSGFIVFLVFRFIFVNVNPNLNIMKTSTLKNAFKLFLFLLILFSAKAFSFTKLPNEESSRGTGSKFGSVSKSAITTKKETKNYAAVYKSNAALSKTNKRFKK
jgi:hypothetical protein